MKQNDVVWSRTALDDLIDIARYIAKDRPKAALKLASRLRMAGDDLALFATGKAGRMPGIFERPVSGTTYTMAYAIDQETADRRRLTILRVIHHPRDWPEGAWPKD